MTETCIRRSYFLLFSILSLYLGKVKYAIGYTPGKDKTKRIKATGIVRASTNMRDKKKSWSPIVDDIARAN
jgi:hypothetical protein